MRIRPKSSPTLLRMLLLHHEHYQSRFEEGGSGKLIINSLTSDRLNGTFSADIPMSPFNGDRLKINDGKINTKIKRIN